jgi:acetyl esterase/lipase
MARFSATATVIAVVVAALSAVTLAVDADAAPVRIGGVAVEPGDCTALVYTPPAARRVQIATLCTPEAVESDAAVVLVHGGGGINGSRADLRAWQDVYRSRGVVSLSIDYQLLGTSVERPLYPVPEQNTKAAVQFLRLHGDVLGVDNIVVQGHSAGARLGAIALTTPGDPAFAGDELWPGVTDAVDGFVGFYGYYDGGQFEGGDYYGGNGTPSEGADSIAQAAAASGAALLFHGEDDSLIAPDRSTQLDRALDDAGRDSTLVLVGGANHGFDGYDREELTESGATAASAIVAWLEAL